MLVCKYKTVDKLYAIKCNQKDSLYLGYESDKITDHSVKLVQSQNSHIAFFSSEDVVRQVLEEYISKGKMNPKNIKYVTIEEFTARDDEMYLVLDTDYSHNCIVKLDAFNKFRLNLHH